MRVAIITGAMPLAKCGVGDYTDVLVTNLVKAGVNVDVITDVKYGESDKSYTLHNVVKKWYGFTFFSIILSTLKNINCDVVHIQYPTISYKGFVEINILPLILRLKGYKVVYTLHEYSQRPFLSRVRRWPSVFGSHNIIVVEDIFKKDLVKLPFFKSSKDKIEVIHIGANIPKSSYSNDEILNVKKELFGDYDGLVASYFGFVNSNKVLLVTIETMGRLKKENKLFFKLLIISHLDLNDSYQSEVLKLITQYDLTSEVKVTGFLPKEDVGNYIACSDFGISLFANGLSVRNGSFLALYQEGIKIIATKPSEDYPIALNNVIFIDNNRVDELKNALLKISHIDLSKTHEQITDWDEIAQKHVLVYQRVNADVIK
ncbi:glycosyltransferase [Pedobacter sp.]|uniref:glycosyltransferase n=1 Tax=Pedobacter sp. TaxID=1411316 RepID=UPI0031CE81F2